jgi:hypothetical protein
MYARAQTSVKTAVRPPRIVRSVAESGPRTSRWQPGDPVVIRETWGDRIFEARPATVVHDDPEQTVLFVHPGARVAVAVGEDGMQLRLPDRPWRMEIREARAFSILSFAWPDTPYSVLLLRDPEGVFLRWYINLQEPLRRTSIGFDTVDHALDALIEPDRSSWSWKDEEELGEAVESGLFSPAEALWFRHWGERGVEHVVLREPPFDRDWESWRPDPGWPEPKLSPGWDRPMDRDPLQRSQQ